MTAPITSNRPTTTRLHHYAGRHSHGSGIPVETFFAPAWGASTPVETFFAHAHPKWLIFDHFHLAGAIFLSQRHPKLPPGATQGRSFFHTAPRDDTESPPVWRAPRGMGPGRGAHGRRQGQGGPRDRPLRAQLACGDLAGGPPPTGTHSGRTPQSSPARQVRPDGARNTRGGHKQPGPAGARQRLRLGDLAARLTQGQAAVAVDGGTHVDEARARQERRVGAGAKLADGVQAFGGEAPSELGHEVGH